jgi:chromosome segregation ATPase/DNA-binding response OmpR family regulator
MAFDVLVVESDENLVGELNSALEREGFRVHSEDDADNAYAWAQRERPRLLILAVELKPNRPSGFTLCRKLRQDGDLSQVPIFIMTAAVTSEVIEKHRTTKYPANRYFFKPVSVAELVAAVSEFVSPINSSGSSTVAGELDLGFGDELDSLLAIDRMEAEQRSENLRQSQQLPAVPDSSSAVTLFPTMPPIRRNRQSSQSAAVAPPAPTDDPSVIPETASAVEPASQPESEPLASAPPTTDPASSSTTAPFEGTTAAVADSALVPTPLPNAGSATDEVGAELRAEVSRLRAELEEARAAATLAQAQVVHAQQELHRVTSLERELAGVRQQLDSGRAQVSMLERQLSDAQATANASSPGSAAAARELLTLRTALNRAEGEVLRYKDEVFARDHRIVEMLEASEQRDGEVQRLQNARNEVESSRSALQARIAALEAAVSDGEERQANAALALSQADAHIGALQERLADAERLAAQQLAQLEEANRQAQSVASEHTEKVARLDERLNEAEGRASEMATQIQKTTQDLESAGRLIAEASQARDSLQQSLGATSHELTRANARIHEFGVLEASLRGELRQAEEREGGLRAQLDEANQTIEASQAALEEGAAVIEALQATINTANAENQQLLEQLNTARTAMADMSEQLTLSRSQWLSTQELLTGSQRQVENLTAELAGVNQQASDLQTSLASVREELAATQVTRDRLSSELTTSAQQLNDAMLLADHVTQELQTVSERERSLVSSRDELQQRLDALSVEKSRVDVQLSALTVERDALRAEVAADNEMVEELTASLAAQATDQAGLQQQLTALNELLQDLSATLEDERQQSDTARALADERLARMKDERDEHRQRAEVTSAELTEMSALASAERSRLQHQMEEFQARILSLEPVAARVAPLEQYVQAAESLISAQADDLAALRRSFDTALAAIHSRDALLNELSAAVTMATEVVRNRPAASIVEAPASQSVSLQQRLSDLKPLPSVLPSTPVLPLQGVLTPDAHVPIRGDGASSMGFSSEVAKAASETGSVPVIGPDSVPGDVAARLSEEVYVPLDGLDDEVETDELVQLDTDLMDVNDL